MTYEEILAIHHAVFQQIAPSLYRVEKDMLNHISTGSKISSQMLNCYLSIVPSSVRVKVIECKMYEEKGNAE